MGRRGSKDPYRTGGWVIVKDEAVRRMIQPEALVEHIIKRRMCFVPDSVWTALGLPAIETLKPLKEVVG